MSQVTDKAKQLAQAAQDLVDANEKLDSLHDAFNKSVQEYKDMLAAQVGPDKAAQVTESSVTDIKSDTVQQATTMKGNGGK